MILQITNVQEYEPLHQFRMCGCKHGRHPSSHGMTHQRETIQAQVCADAADELQAVHVVIRNTWNICGRVK